MENNPLGVAGTLWGHCLELEMQRAKDEGRLRVEFAAVDARVIELSKRITEWRVHESREGE